MTVLMRTIILLVLFTALAGAAGGWIGFRYGIMQAHHDPSLDDILHRHLGITADQEHRIAALTRAAGERVGGASFVISIRTWF